MSNPRTCNHCHRELGRRYETSIGPSPDYGRQLWCTPCYREAFPGETLPITVGELISQLQALPDWAKELPVMCSYDGGCATGVYGVNTRHTEGSDCGGGRIYLIGD